MRLSVRARRFEEDWAADEELVDQARSNTLENFRLVFDPKFMDTIEREH